MSREAEKKKLPVAKLAVGAVVLLALAVLLLRGFDVRGAVEQGMAVIRAQGPVVFFAAFALLPAIGVPASVFTLTVAPVFGERLGLPAVVLLAMAAIMVNVMLTYVLARRALRPVLEKLLTRFGYRLPQLAPEDITDFAIIVRVTPGSPFVVQNYLLGIAGVPFGKNLLVAFLVQLFYTPAFVLFGDAVLHGKGRMAMLAAGLFVVAVVATHWARKHYAKKKRSE
ncbi:TVP38/TMEM64 family protein [Opitutus terrae]|uniref:TVP38/TMEM64 family membrane protein n=1 Tax=Opitutus terrae (strain DSM 11246 / JCM 15787 / PB90-1) TaxID=452637 RepID=B1ZVX4_OPITP|nr:TVP38/TMEM64 family protein [Opitutus terrae]ACB75060.1 SNARE associated Golgi protein [Opitutus terrae PB90-1]